MGLFDMWNLPTLSHIDQADGAFTVFSTVQGRGGSIYRFPLVDLESSHREETYRHFSELLKLVGPHEITRFVLLARESKAWEGCEERAPRISQIGRLEKELLVSIERETHPGMISRLLGAGSGATRIPLSEFGARPLEFEEIEPLFQDPTPGIDCRKSQLDFGSSVVGVLRLVDSGRDGLDSSTLAGLLDQVPTPFECQVSLKKVPPARVDLGLRAKLNRDRFQSDSLTAHKLQATEVALRDISLFGAELFEIEWLLVLTRESECDLRRDLAQAKRVLSPMGNLEIETIGAGPSYVATRFGAKQHVTFSEISPTVLYFLPITTFGEGTGQECGSTADPGQECGNATDLSLRPINKNMASALPLSGLLLHRQDGSVHSFDNFNKAYMAYNCLIAGKTGSGKSAFANAVTRAVLNDPKISVIKVDVGGSSSRECRLAGGVEKNFHLDSPSGIDPFLEFSGNDTTAGNMGNTGGAVTGNPIGGNVTASTVGVAINEAVSVLTEFVAALALEEGEAVISKSLRAEYEVAVKNFILSSKHGQGFQQFLSENPTLTRANLLARWTKGGVFENAIKADVGTAADNQPTGTPNRYTYYNFGNIQGAANKDYSSGVMAAVIASVNLEMIRLSTPKSRAMGLRLVFMCDETKFFIVRNAAFFLLTTANFRKFGHSTVLISQNIEDFILKTDSCEDRGLLLHSPTRIVFEGQLKEEFLRRELGFDDRHIDALIKSPYRGNDYRQFVLQDDLGTRLCRLYLTPHEYWAMSSKREDVDKIEKLRAAAPWLTEEALIDVVVRGIKCS